MTLRALQHLAMASATGAGLWLVSAVALDWPLRVLVAAGIALVLSLWAVGFLRGEILLEEQRRRVTRVDPSEDLFAKD